MKFQKILTGSVLLVALIFGLGAPAFAQNNVLDLKPADVNSDGDVVYGIFIYNRLFSISDEQYQLAKQQQEEAVKKEKEAIKMAREAES